MKAKLIGEDRVLIKAPEVKEDVSALGIVLSSEKVVVSYSGEVVQSNYPTVLVGATVCYKKMRGDTQVIEGETYIILEAEDILLVED